MTRRVQLFYNPYSGSFSRQRLLALVKAYADNGFTAILTQSSFENSGSLEAGTDQICIAGGDGTVRQVVHQYTSAAGTAPIFIYPMGTVNLIALEQESAADPHIFVQQTLSDIPRSFYPVHINDAQFLVCASIGPDSLAVSALSERLKRHIGRLAYGIALLQQIVRWLRPEIQVRAPGRNFKCEALYIAKGRYYGGRWSFAPDARLDQPLLHVVALKRARRRDFFAFILAIIFSRVERLQNTLSFTCTELELRADRAWPVQADGDIVAYLPCRIRLDRSAINAPGPVPGGRGWD